jgi:ribosomal protein L11 methyltransferase
MPSKFYYELEIAFNKKNYESIYNHLYVSGIKNILEENGIIKVSLDESRHLELERIMKGLVGLGITPKNDVTLSKLDNLNWNKEWEKTIEPVYVHDRIIIYPSWKKNLLRNTKGKILIEIDPKMSFGTGHNETTQIILELMCKHISAKDKYMLDFGCGTGILAIAGIKLGLTKALAIDIDEDSIENAAEYLKVNKTNAKIELIKTDINEIEETGFDVIAANITSNVIIPNLPVIYDKLNDKGKVFLTGILFSEKVGVAVELIKNNFEIEDVIDKEEWTSFYAIKK